MTEYSKLPQIKLNTVLSHFFKLLLIELRRNDIKTKE